MVKTETAIGDRNALWDVDARGFGFIGFSSGKELCGGGASGYAIAQKMLVVLIKSASVFGITQGKNTGAAGDVVACVRRKQQFLVRNSSTDPVTQAEFPGSPIYIEDKSNGLLRQMEQVLVHWVDVLWALMWKTLNLYGWRFNNDF